MNRIKKSLDFNNRSLYDVLLLCVKLLTCKSVTHPSVCNTFTNLNDYGYSICVSQGYREIATNMEYGNGYVCACYAKTFTINELKFYVLLFLYDYGVLITAITK